MYTCQTSCPRLSLIGCIDTSACQRIVCRGVSFLLYATGSHASTTPGFWRSVRECMLFLLHRCGKSLPGLHTSCTISMPLKFPFAMQNKTHVGIPHPRAVRAARCTSQHSGCCENAFCLINWYLVNCFCAHFSAIVQWLWARMPL